MLSLVARFIRDEGLLPNGCGALAGVSGGADSVALLRVLFLMRDELGITLEAAHFNHGIRAESAGEEQFVTALCEELGVTLHVGRADVPKLAREQKVSLEVAARQARHSFFRQVLAGRGLSRLALAHHRDDRAETVLLRLVRGAGADGLGSMAPLEPSGIVRPLLCVGREDIRAWCRENGFQWVEDASNADTSIPRNWVRHKLLPLIGERLNPSVAEALARSAELLAEDSQYLNGLARAALINMETLPGGGVTVPAGDLAGLAKPVQSRAVRQMLVAAGLVCDVERANVVDVAALLGPGRTGRRVDLDGGAAALREAEQLAILPRLPETVRWEPVPLAIPGETEACGGVFRCSVMDAAPAGYREHGANEQYFDLEAFPADAVARGRRDGDRFHPLGGPGSRKLKEYLIDRKVGRWSRDGLPLLVCGADVLWVVGHGIADGVKITDNTGQVLHITYAAKENHA